MSSVTATVANATEKDAEPETHSVVIDGVLREVFPPVDQTCRPAVALLQSPGELLTAVGKNNAAIARHMGYRLVNGVVVRLKNAWGEL